MLRLLDVVIDSKYGFKDKVAFLKSFSNTGTFTDEDAESVDLVSRKIKALLSTSERREGMLLLQIFLDECGTDVFVENALSWAHLTLKVFKSADNVEDKSLACLVFQQLIPLLPAFPALCKQFQGSVVQQLYETIMRVSPEDEWAEDAFNLLLCCMKTFPGTFGPHKVTIENYILKHLGEWSNPVLKILAACVSQLPWCGGGGVHGANHSTAWSTQLDCLLTSLDKILDHFYHGVDIYEDGSPLILSSLELPAIPHSDPLLSIYHVHRHFQFLGLCLLEIFSIHHSTALKIPFDDLLSFIWKALSVNSIEMLEKPSLDAVAIASLIPSIHCTVLSLLETLICGYGRLLAMHAHTINHILLRSLSWTSTNGHSYGMERPYSAVRIQTYLVVQVWMKSLGASAAVHEQGDSFVNHFLSDLKVEQDGVQLQSPSGLDRPRGRKRKRKQAEMIASSVSTEKKINAIANQELCLEALIALKGMLYTCGSLLDVELHKKIHSVIVRILVEVQQQSQCGSFATVPIPYSSTDCRRELYSTLLACVLCPHSQWPPPLEPSVVLFKQGLLDPCLEISSFCTEGMAILNTILHPRVTVIQYLEKQEETQPLHPVASRASNMMAEPSVLSHVHHSMHDDTEEEVEFAAYSQVHASLKKDPAWRVKEATVHTKQHRPVLNETTESISMLMPASQQQQQPPQTVPLPLPPPQVTMISQPKPSPPPTLTQQLKSHPPPATQPQQPLPPVPQPAQPATLQPKLQPHHGQQVKPSQRPGRGSATASEEVVVLSEEESAEENHMEDGGEEDEEDEEEEDEEEEEEEEYYPEEEEDGDYDGHMKGDRYGPRDESPSLVLTGTRSTEDSSSTGLVVSSVLGNLVTEAACSMPKVQKARRTGILARTEHSHGDVEKGEMDDMGEYPMEDEDGEYDEEDYDEDEEEAMERECEDEQDDIEEIGEVDEHGSEEHHQYHMNQKWHEEPDGIEHQPPGLDQEGEEETTPIIISARTEEAGDAEPEEKEMATLQPLQCHPSMDEHSTEAVLGEDPEEQLVLSAHPVSASDEQEEAPDETLEQSGNSSDVIELSDSPVKEFQKVPNENKTPPYILSKVETVQQTELEAVQNDSEVKPEESQLASEATDRLAAEDDENCVAIEVEGTDTRVAEEPVAAAASSDPPSPQAKADVVNDVEMVVEEDDEVPLPTNEHSNQVTENRVNHSTGQTSNCASDEYSEDAEEPRTVSGGSSGLKAQNVTANCTLPDGPDEPAAKKICILNEKEPEPEEESPPVDDMLKDFVCCARRDVE